MLFAKIKYRYNLEIRFFLIRIKNRIFRINKFFCLKLAIKKI